MDEYLAAISNPTPPAAAASNLNTNPPQSGGAGGGSMSLWTPERIKRLGSAVRSLSARGITAYSRTNAADLIYHEMKDKDLRLSPAEVNQFLKIFFSTRCSLFDAFYTSPKLQSQKIQWHLQGPQLSRRFSPYSAASGNNNKKTNAAARSAAFAWGLKTHRMFLDAVERLGGVEMAEPAAILRLMKESGQENTTTTSGIQSGQEPGQILNGLRVGEVGRHLVKFRNLIGLPGTGPMATVAALSSQAGGSSMLDFFEDLKL